VGLSVTTRASSFQLTTKERVKLEVPSIPLSGDDPFLDALIDAASDAIQSYCNRDKAPFARQLYVETLGAFGDISLMLKATPLVLISSVLQDGAVLTDWSIEDADSGLLYRRNQFTATAQLNPGLGGRQTFPWYGSPIPGAEELRFTVTYIAGHLVPAQDLIGKATISADAADDSINDSDGGFPELLKAGDTVRVSGFETAANNGRFTVTGTPTTSKIPLVASLTTEAASAPVSVFVRTLPFDLEKAAVETVKGWYFDREKATSVRRERVGATDTEYADPLAIRTGLPASAIGYLRAFMRAA
jgi:hypothetical protein